MGGQNSAHLPPLMPHASLPMPQIRRPKLKRILFLAFTTILISGNAFAADKLKVVTTISDLASLTQEIGGDRIDVTAIAKGYQDPHFVEPKPSFLLLLRNADLLEVVGLELEIGWLPPLLDQSRNPRIQVGDRKSTRLNSSHLVISYAVFCLKKKKRSDT